MGFFYFFKRNGVSEKKDSVLKNNESMNEEKTVATESFSEVKIVETSGPAKAAETETPAVEETVAVEVVAETNTVEPSASAKAAETETPAVEETVAVEVVAETATSESVVAAAATSETVAEQKSETTAEKPKNHSYNEVWPKSAILARAKQAEKKVTEWITTYGNKFDQLEFAFNFYAGCRRVHIVYDETEMPGDIWYIGDVHGDILALDAALSYIDSHSISPTIVFSGDLIDRFDYSLEVVMRIIALIIERPGKILWLAGNHDIALGYADGKFVSGVTPAEFADFLNEHKEYEEFGKWLVEFMQVLPIVLFLPDGLFVAHAGIPGYDEDSIDWTNPTSSPRNLVDKVETLEELECEYWFAFTNYRIGEDVHPPDLPLFMNAMAKFTNYPVKCMLRGHDHRRETRHEFSTEAPYLTMVTLSTWYLADNDSTESGLKALCKTEITTPAIARHRFKEMPEVITLNIPQSVVEQFHKVEELKNA